MEGAAVAEVSSRGELLVGFLVLVRPQVGLGFQVRSAKTFCL